MSSEYLNTKLSELHRSYNHDDIKLIESSLELIYNCAQKDYKKFKIHDKEYFLNNTKLKQLSSIVPFGLNKVQVKPSNIHGNGVFATKDIKIGELITFYPGNIVECYPNKDRFKDGHYTLNYRGLNNIKRGDNNYAFDVSDEYTIFGDKDFKTDPNYMGHLINDGAKSNLDPESIPIYIKISTQMANCDFHKIKDLHVAIIATKNINKGEELLITYGPSYWNSYNKNIKISNNHKL